MAVEGAELSPVTCGMAGQVIKGMCPLLREQFQGPRRGQDPPEGERRPHRPLLASNTILGGFGATFVSQIPPASSCVTRFTWSPSPPRDPPH
jgi:hypothetical protein